jgi:hypothetical protein
LVKEVVEPALAGHGFVRRGRSLARLAGANWQVVDFQADSYAESTDVTVNLGVVSSLLHAFYGTPIRRPPSWTDLDWYVRIADVLPDSKDDKWWHLTEDNLESVGAEILDIIRTRGLSLLEAHSDDEQLLALWNRGRDPFKDEARYLMDFSALLSLKGRIHESRQAADKLRSIANQLEDRSIVDAHFARLAALDEGSPIN